MKRFVAALSAAALLLASAPAFADGYRYKHRGYGHGKHYGKGYGHYGGHYRHKGHGYKHHGRGHRGGRHYGRKGYDYGPVIVGALVGGVVLGHLLSRPAYSAPSSYAPPPRPVLGNCRATVGTGYYRGRPAQFGGTMCFDPYGRGYITPGSEYFIGYLR